MWADSHCHLTYEDVGGAAIEAARAAGVTRMITIGTDAGESAAAIEIARAHAGVWATVGLHPHDAVQGVEGIATLLERSDPVVVGVGECGLDYHYDHSPRDVQAEVFAAQIALAHAHDLTLVIHTREAWDDTFAILEAERTPPRTVFHCFSGGPAEDRAVKVVDVADARVRSAGKAERDQRHHGQEIEEAEVLVGGPGALADDPGAAGAATDDQALLAREQRGRPGACLPQNGACDRREGTRSGPLRLADAATGARVNDP